MKIEDLISKLPPMKTGAELTKALEDIPPYYEDVRNADTTTRLMGLSELYNIYIPSSMSHEIYTRIDYNKKYIDDIINDFKNSMLNIYYK